MAKKGRKKEEDVDSYRHEAEIRKNAVPVGLASYDTSKPKPKKYDYDPHLDPQLVWSGKKDQASFEVPIVSNHEYRKYSNKFKYTACVKVVDIFGSDTSITMETEY